LIEYGVSVIAEDINPAIEDLYADIDTVAPLIGDVAQEQSAKDAVALAGRRFGQLDILINNAGTIINKPVIETTLEDWNHILRTNVTGAFLHTREALRAMIPHQSGAIVNIGSYACFQTFKTISAYTASKGALAQLTRTAALEAIDDGIRVNALGVGDVITNILGDPNNLVEHGKGAPIQRAADPAEIAHAAAFLASDGTVDLSVFPA
jgi:glucose 1-dehydrogenase